MNECLNCGEKKLREKNPDGIALVLQTYILPSKCKNKYVYVNRHEIYEKHIKIYGSQVTGTVVASSSFVWVIEVFTNAHFSLSCQELT